jgi:hypothetical protein
MKIHTLLLLLIPLINHGQSSDKEVFHIRYGTAPLSPGAEKDILQSVDVNVKFPVLVKDKTLLAGGLGYETLWTNQFSLFQGRSVQGLSAQWLLNHSLGNHRAILVGASVGVYSDFKDVSGEDIRYALGIRYKTKLHDKFTISYGMGLSKQFFGLMVAPFIDFDWKMTERVRLSGPIPLNTRLRYMVSSRSELTLFLKPDNATFRLSGEDYDSRYFQKKQWNVGAGIDYQMTRHWLLALRGGYSLRRKFEIFEASESGVLSIFTFDLRGGKRTPYFQHEERAFFADVTLAWIIGRD